MATATRREPAVAPAGPRVSVVMPCRNEALHIEACLQSLLGGSLGDLEILVVDGGSVDHTRRLVAELSARDPRVRLIDNPEHTTPVGLNLGILAARGEIVVRADAHATYPPEYVALLVRTLEETGADLVGTAMEAVPADDSLRALAICYAVAGGFATGSAFRYRSGGRVDTVPFGCWRRSLFDRIGLFDPRLTRNQDNEHASRILHRGGRIHQTTALKLRYIPRATLREHLRQRVQNGMWNAFTQRLHPYAFRWRHFLPALFFLGVLFCVGLALAGAALGRPLFSALAAALLLPYLSANLLVSVEQARLHARPALAPVVAVTLFAQHFVYGYGIVLGWLLIATGRWRRRLGGQKGWKEVRS
jgi:glycosyltransferase involved in cell wall biosynthesis